VFLSIFFIIFLIRVFEIVPFDVFTTALFSCISMPAMYALTYYYRREFVFVVSKKQHRLHEFWAREFYALILSFLIGFLAFIALTGSFDVFIFSLAYICVHVLRILFSVLLPFLKHRYVDVEHPVVVVVISIIVSIIILVFIMLILHIC